MTTKIVTKESLQTMVNNTNNAFVIQTIGKALVCVFNNQTKDEQVVNDTKINNMIGFTGADAKSGSLTAKYFLKHKTLLPWMVENWTKRGSTGYSRITKYHKQLNEAAVLKASKQSS